MVKKRKRVHYTGFMPVLLGMVGLVLLAVSVTAGDSENAVHPELTEQEMLIACADCHREVTPEVEKQWYNSVHGIAMVKCYQCHGTYENFMVTPTRQNCDTCHSDVHKRDPQDKPCWECHVPHSFKEKK
ncbi:MAG: cytochrome c3 family protein [Desulforhopalus sp.]